MILDILSRLFTLGRALLIPIQLDNALSAVYVVLDLLSKIFLLGYSPEGGFNFLNF